MITNIPTVDLTREEVRLLRSTEDDLYNHGETDVKCPRCGGAIVLKDFDTSYVIGCEHDCVKIGFRGI